MDSSKFVLWIEADKVERVLGHESEKPWVLMGQMQNATVCLV